MDSRLPLSPFEGIPSKPPPTSLSVTSISLSHMASKLPCNGEPETPRRLSFFLGELVLGLLCRMRQPPFFVVDCVWVGVVQVGLSFARQVESPTAPSIQCPVADTMFNTTSLYLPPILSSNHFESASHGDGTVHGGCL